MLKFLTVRDKILRTYTSLCPIVFLLCWESVEKQVDCFRFLETSVTRTGGLLLPYRCIDLIPSEGAVPELNQAARRKGQHFRRCRTDYYGG